MKKLLLLLLLFSTGLKAQVVIDLSSYAKKSEVNELKATQVKQQKTIDSLSKVISGGVVVNPPVTKEDCKPNPTISEITNVSSKGLTFKFDANGLTNMKYMITGSKVYIDSIKPKSNTIDIVFPSLFTNGTYTLSIEGINCNGSNSRTFTIAGGVDPPSAADCKKQPTFKINGFTNQSATIQFDADGLKTLTLAVVQGDKVLKTTTYNPDVNTLFFQFGQVLPAGNYQITLSPVSCTAKVTSQDFTIKSEDVGTIDPPIETDPADINYKLITQGMDEHMRITRRTVGDIDYITDNTANPLQSNYKYHYVVGSQVITQSTPLKDYPYARNNGFRVVKFNKKDGVQSMNEWPGQGEDGSIPGGYYKNDAGQSFVYNASAAVTTGVYGGSQSGFKNYIPANYDPTLEMPQWADIMPDLKLPKGHFFVLRKGDWSIDQVLKKGVTHISHFELPRPNGDESQAVAYKQAGLTYSDVPTSFMLFGNPLPNNPSNEEVDRLIAKHNLTDAFAVWETMENQHNVDVNTNSWVKRFNEGYAAIQKRNFTDKGIPALFAYNYFQFWPTSYHLGQVSSEVSKRNFRIPNESLEKTAFSPGGTLSPTTLIVEAIYLGAPDIQQNGVLDFAYKLSLFEKMGYVGGGFLASEHEFRPNNIFLSNFLDGKYYSKGKIPLDPNSLVTYTIFSHVFGKVFVQWGGTGKINAGRIFDKFTFEPTYWKVNGSSEYKTSTRNSNYNGGLNGDVFPYQSNPDFPHQKAGGVGYYGYNGGVDLCRFALQVYADTWAQLDGGEKSFLSYRLDGGNWVEAVNQYVDDIVDASSQKRGFAYSINKNGKIAWFYVNPFADNTWHDLEVKFPNGKIVKNRVSSNGIHIKLENY